MSEASTRSDGDLDQRLAQVRLAVFDVDGTLTDGRVTYVGAEELQSFSVRDGYALARLRPAGIQHVWITGRGCEATERRAKELGVTRLITGARDKAQVLAELQAELGLGNEETLAMGDDLPDLAMRPCAAVFAAPADAAAEVLACADLVTSAPAGAGAAREVCRRLLAAHGAWPEGAERP